MMRALLPIICLLMTGCAGVDSESHFKCKAPEGIGCSSLSGTYANAVEDNLPGSPAKKSATNNKDDEKERAITGSAPQSGTPILNEPIVLRIWVAPWEDARKVLHDQAYLYVIADPGQWQVAHTKKQIAGKYRVLAPAARKSPPQEKQTRQPQFQPPGAAAQQSSEAN